MNHAPTAQGVDHAPSLISTPHAKKSLKGYLEALSLTEVGEFLDGLSQNALMSLPWLFEHWALPQHQLAPEGDWKTWVILGGRGAGKTRAGSEWVRMQVEGSTPEAKGKMNTVALVAATVEQARDVMVFGNSGILACSPPDRRPEWEASRKRLVWKNGATAQIFSAADPESLRGPQFDCAWVDELGKWPKCRETWDMLQFALRLGDDPRQVVTTTPRSNSVLRDILGRGNTVMTSAPTSANRANLAASFLEEVEERYAGTRLGREELFGEMLNEVEGALWALDSIERVEPVDIEKMDRIVVAVDPPVTTTANADACGIVVAGVVMNGKPADWKAYVIEDASVQGLSPQEWTNRVVGLARKYGADRVVAEVNQGGDLVGTLMRSTDPLIPFKPVRAIRGKSARAEPIAALYEQGRVAHAGVFDELETQMCAMSTLGYMDRGSPDRVDALVWALTDLMVEPAFLYRTPRLRSL